METYILLLCIILLFFLVLTLWFIRQGKKKRRALLASVKESSAALELIKSELIKHQENIEIEVKSRTETFIRDYQEQEKIDISLKKALKKSEDANFLKNAFLSNISHEIRTPLNNIIGFSNLLEAEISLLENKELFEYARAISESGDRLLNLLNNILDISRIESHDLHIDIKSCDLNSVVANTVQLFVFKANEQKIKLNYIANEVPPTLGDEKNLTKVISAIIENAIKYTENGFVNVSTDFHSTSNETSIRIKDSGCGIDAAYLPAIFNPFRQESSGYSKELQGAGLGLPLAKSLIELMRGRITIESVKGSGTTVTIYLPTKILTTSDNQTIPITKKQKFTALQGLEIFIVEDDLMNKLVLYEMTKSLGNVKTAINGDETLSIIGQFYKEGKIFDIMLFDINLPPPWDGTRLMIEIRKKWKEYKTIPFIAQTAYAMAGDKEKLLEAGFDDYISKPINQHELYSIIKNQLNKY